MGSEMVKVAVLGYGTVGSGVVEVLQTNRDDIARRAGNVIEVGYVLDLREFPGDPVETILVHDYEEILADPEVRVIVETMGGVNPAYDFTKRALQSGRHVCTSNKELVAQHGVELLEIARAKNVNYLIEASCGGGIPIIRALNTSLTADRIEAITGILNGTTNYILSKMAIEGLEFDEALSQAQANGYAERNPEADIEGHDACRKIAILSSLAYGSHIDYTEVCTEGITRVSTKDMLYASALNASIKLLAFSKREGDRVSIAVCPAMIRRENPLFMVEDVFNAVLVRGNMLGDAMFYGSGAGRLPTASAVAADVVDCAMHLEEHLPVHTGGEPLNIVPIEETTSRFFVRIEGEVSAHLSEITGLMGEVEVVAVPEITGEFGFVTQPLKEAEFLKDLDALRNVHGRFIRVFF